MINLQNLTLIRGDKTLLDNVSLILHAKQKIGLIGQNGCGKSSLLSVILRDIDPNLGEITYHKGCQIAHVAQETPALDCAALDYILQGHEKLWTILTELKTAEDTADYDRAAHLYLDLDEIHGYSLQYRASELLHHLGFSSEQKKAAVASFSGGWRMRLNLARALFTPADLLLLDEPTNHLDLEAIIWLEKWLADCETTLIIISHDREFLDKIVTHIVHMDRGSIKLYKGNYSAFEAQRVHDLALQQATFEKQQRKVKHLMRFVDRFRYKATKAKQAQSRLKMIDKMENVAAVQAESALTFEFFEPKPCANPMLTLKNVSCAYGESVILQDINLQVIKGDRVGLIGVNGSGKSTFIKALTNQINIQGEMTYSANIKIGYFAQHQLEYLEPDATPLEHLQRLSPGSSVQQLRNYLGGFAFSGDMALSLVANLSGGERARLALSMLIWEKPSLLLLDEPTNHLDIDMRMALAMALQNYNGALILVSHDRYLMETLTDQLWLVHNKSVTPYDGALQDYKQALLASDKPQKVKKAKAAKAVQSKKTDLQTIERELTKLQLELKKIDEQLADPELYQSDDRNNLTGLQTQKKNLQGKITQLEARWMDASE